MYKSRCRITFIQQEQIVQGEGTNEPGGEQAKGRISQRVNNPGSETAKGQKSHNSSPTQLNSTQLLSQAGKQRVFCGQQRDVTLLMTSLSCRPQSLQLST